MELRHRVQVNNISVKSGSSQRHKNRKEEYDRRLKWLNPDLPQVKQISSCQQAKHDRAISLKAAIESEQNYH